MLLREKDRQSLIQIFESIQTPMEVWAYGSRVKGTAHSGSDLDLVVRSETLKPISSPIFATLHEKIINSNIPILVELRDWALLPNNFHPNILEHHEVLFSNLDSLVAEPKANYQSNSDSN